MTQKRVRRPSPERGKRFYYAVAVVRRIAIPFLMLTCGLTACSIGVSINSGTSPSPTPRLGKIEVAIGYPSSSVPAMRVYAVRVDQAGTVLELDTPEGPTSGTLVRATFNDVPPGRYHLLAYKADNPDIRAGYTRAVACGLDVSCIDHSLVDVVVAPGQNVTNIQITDYYSDSIPQEPNR